MPASPSTGGRSPLLRLALSLWLALPLGWLLAAAMTDQLGANPQEALLRSLGEVSLAILLLVVLVPGLARLGQALTPGQGLGLHIGLADLRAHRRLLGLTAFAYSSLHLAAFWAFEHDFQLLALLSDGLQRPFVTAGLVVWCLLLPLALTSNRWSMRQLGSGWKRLHLLVWPAIAIGLLHFVLHKAGKNDYSEPLLYAVVFLAALAGRLVLRKAGHRGSRAR